MAVILLGANPILQSYYQSDLFGRLIFLTLFVLSCVSWSLLVYKLIFLKKTTRQSVLFNDLFMKMRAKPLHVDWKYPESINPELVVSYNIYRSLRKKTFEILKKNQLATNNQKAYLTEADINALGDCIHLSILAAKKNLQKNLFILSTIVSLAPFLGLLGTVWGILMTFLQLQTKTLGHSNDAVLGGISMALGTTVLGLLVAIPALVAYNYLKQKVVDMTTDMEKFGGELLGAVEYHYRYVESV